MSQIELKEALAEAKHCLMRDDFEGVFQIADDTTRRQYTDSLADDTYRKLMIHAWVAACIASYKIKKELYNAGLEPPPDQRQPPGLRIATFDPYGLYRLSGLKARYVKQAGHTVGRDYIIVHGREIAKWYFARPLPVIEETIEMVKRNWRKRITKPISQLADRFDRMLKQAIVITRWQALHPEYFSSARSYY